MTDVQTQLEQRLQAAVVASLGAEHASVEPGVGPATNPRFGDYQANLAMRLAKQVGSAPRELAACILEYLDQGELIAKAEIAGPGFINLTLTDQAICKTATQALTDPRLGVEISAQPKKVVIDYSSPNVAKEMHIGHLRSTLIGDALARVLEFLGHRVVRQNHVGDWGTQFGMLIEHLIETVDTEQIETGSYQIGDLNTFYQQAKQKFDADENFATRARQRVVSLQGGDASTVALWRSFFSQSMEHFEQVYERLGVLLMRQDVRGESSYNDQLAPIVEELSSQGALHESEGARVLFPEGFSGKDGEPRAMIVQKSDGGYLYATTDLAAARHRMDTLEAERMIYVTDARQAQHFAMLFQVLLQLGWSRSDLRFDHVPFGMILGKNGKPFASRDGTSVRLADVLDEAVQRAAETTRASAVKMDLDMSDDEVTRIARVVGIGALKYADLCNDRIKDYVFDWDRMLALDGNTAPYILNAYVRIRGVFRKGELEMSSAAAWSIQVTATDERALAAQLLKFSRIVESVADSLEPHRLSQYLYELARRFHRFFEKCPVLRSEGEIRESRLALCLLTARTLEQGLGLLGIGIVDRM